MSNDKQHRFIEAYDDLALSINEKANQLYQQLQTLNTSNLDIDEFGSYYFNRHHGGKRSFFSIQSSAHIIYHSVRINNKPIQDTSFIDYGAGLGTLFLLAGLVGFKKVYYNDHLPQWARNAGSVCDKLGIKLDAFIPGDIDDVIGYGKKNNVSFDIFASRNVVEHIYDLRGFYTTLYRSGLTSVCYSTTTANYHNIAMRLKHHWYHQKVEKDTYKKQREEYIKELVPAIGQADLIELVKLTRGRALADFSNAVDLYLAHKTITPVEFLGTNTCDCKTGVWAEHLITRNDYFNIIQKAGFSVEYSAGFWDTHYKYSLVNIITGLFNRIIRITGKKAYWLSPFVNVVACNNQQ